MRPRNGRKEPKLFWNWDSNKSLFHLALISHLKKICHLFRFGYLQIERDTHRFMKLTYILCQIKHDERWCDDTMTCDCMSSIISISNTSLTRLEFAKCAFNGETFHFLRFWLSDRERERIRKKMTVEWRYLVHRTMDELRKPPRAEWFEFEWMKMNVSFGISHQSTIETMIRSKWQKIKLKSPYVHPLPSLILFLLQFFFFLIWSWRSMNSVDERPKWIIWWLHRKTF